MKKIVLLATLFTTIAFAQFNYQLSIKPGGNFDIQIQMRLNNQADIAKVYYDLFLDNNNQKAANENLISQTYSSNLETDLYKLGQHEYDLVTKVKKEGITATIKNSCDLTVYSRQIKTDCTIKSSKAGILGTLFHWGSTIITCAQLDENVDCHVHVSGKAKEKNLVLVKKTDDRLAISGSMKTVKDIYKAFNFLNEGTTTKVTDRFYQTNISNVWEKMIEKLDSNEKLSKKISVISSPIGIMID